MITISKIRGFIAVAEHGSFKLASEQVGRTQPALSTQIANLEATLGVKLFARTTRKTILTDEGERFLISAQRALVELDSAVKELQDTAALRRGRVSVGCVPTLAAHLLPPIIAEFSNRFPAVDLVLRDEVSSVLYEKVSSGELDFAICPEPADHKDLDFQVMFTDWFVVAFRHGHRFSGRKEVRLSQVLKEDNLTLVKGTNLRDILDIEIRGHGMNFEPKYELHHHYSLGGLVEGGLGVAMLPRRAFPMLRGSQLENLPIVRPRIGREVGILKSSWRPETPAVRAFLAIVRPLDTASAGERSE